MRHFSAVHKGGLIRWARITAAVVIPASAACSLLLDRSSTQCTTDADCAKFGGRPSCQNGLCADLGQGPINCFYGTPSQPQDFLNQCASATCGVFDNCGKLGLCNVSSTPPLLSPPTPDAGSSSKPPAMAAADAGDAQMSCAEVVSGTPVYITGSSNFPPLLKQLAPLVIDGGYTPVFLTTNSCTGVAKVIGSDHTMHDSDGTAGLAKYYDSSGNEMQCSLGPSGAAVDVGESDIFSDSCANSGLPGEGITSPFGPVQAMAFIVNKDSPEDVISEEAAREVFGMGGNGGVAKPWIDPQQYYIRNAGTGTQQMIGRAIGVAANQFWGVDRGNAGLVSLGIRLANGTLAKPAIGIISVDYYDQDRPNLKALAFKSTGQDCAYLPDSTPGTFDKRNVRDGHYPIWGPLHFYAQQTSVAASAFLQVATVNNIKQEALDAFIGASLIPACAMSVRRDSEVGPIYVPPPSLSCGCYFEYKSALNNHKQQTLPPECAQCGANMACPDPARPVCNFGFCEIQ